MAELRRLLAARRPLYAEAAHTVDTSGTDTEEVVRRIEALVGRLLAAAGPLHDDVEMMRLVEQEELDPERQGHLAERGVDRPCARAAASVQPGHERRQLRA